MRWLFALAVLLLGALAWADGMYIPPGTIFGEATIPDQRAIIIWDKGQETLIVESTLRGPKADYSWVVPLPSVPTRIEKARASTLPVTFAGFAPNLRRARPEVERALWVGLLFTLPFVAFSFLATTRRKRFQGLAMSICFAASAWLLTQPVWSDVDDRARGGGATKGATPAGDSQGVQVVFRQDVGAYRVSVVKAKKVGDLMSWLDTAGTPLPEKAKSAVAAYIQEGWCFMAAQLRKAEEGDLKPHPLRATFPASEPIYPMRLTGLVAPELDLDLLVIGSKEARVDGLRRWRSRSFPGRIDDTPWHADVALYLPSAGVATRLRGKMKPGQMQKDIRFRWVEFEPKQPQLMSRPALRSDAMVYGLAFGLGGWLLAACLAAAKAWTYRRSLGACLAGAIGLGGFAFAASWFSKPDINFKPQDEASASRDDNTYRAQQIIDNGFKLARRPGWNPFPERLVYCIALTRSRFSGDYYRPATLHRVDPKDLQVAKELSFDDIGGYTVTALPGGEYLFRTFTPWGQIEETRVVDKVLPPSTKPVEVTVTLRYWPERLVSAARRRWELNQRISGDKLVLYDDRGKPHALRWESGDQFWGEVAPGKYTVKLSESHGSNGWSIREIIVPSGQPIRFDARFDVSPFFFP